MAPDEPSFVCARSLLLTDKPVHGSDGGCVAVSPSGRVVCVVGEPDEDAIRAALAETAPWFELVAAPRDAASYGKILNAPGEPATLYVGGVEQPDAPPPANDVSVELLSTQDDYRLAHVPAGLRIDIMDALSRTPVAAAVVEDLPVSFCYPAGLTETYWDVAVETLDGYKRRGLATGTYERMAARMRMRGLRPVWGAPEGNEASREMAKKLRFEAAGALHVWALDRETLSV